MNYVSMMPNMCYNNGFRPQNLYSMPVSAALSPLETNCILHSLSKALNISLRNYEEKCFSTVSNAQNSPSMAKTTSLSTDNSAKSDVAMQGEEPHKENLKNQMEVENSQHMIQNTISLEKSNQARQPHTDDEIHLESKESSSVKKDVCSKKKNKKNNKEEKVDDFVVIVPEVDLNDCAYLPNMGVAPMTLAQKKEELLLRRITDCNDFIKGRKEKREIRMLGN